MACKPPCNPETYPPEHAQLHPDRMTESQPIDLKSWKAPFELALRKHVERVCGEYRSLLDAPSIWESLQEYLLRPGKRLRPLILLAGYRIFSNREPEAACFSLAAATELFHAFVLAHDDIIDRAATRRGRPSLHKAVQAALPCSPERSEHIAMILGDVVFASAVEAMHDPEFAAGAARTAMEAFLRMARDTGVGEFQELVLSETPLDAVSENSIQETYYLKTTRYTFEVPLMIGATLGGADAGTLELLARVTRPIGLGFQIENDLHEIEAADPDDPDLGMDLAAGIKTLPLKRAWDMADPAARKRLECLLRDAAEDRPARLNLLRALQESPAFSLVKQDVEACFKEAADRLAGSPIPVARKAGLQELVRYLLAYRYHTRSNHLPAEET